MDLNLVLKVIKSIPMNRLNRLCIALMLRMLTNREKNHQRNNKVQTHYQSLCATITLILGVIISILVFALAQIQFYFQLSIAIFIISYVAYLCIGCICNTFMTSLRSFEKASYLHDLYNQMRLMQGKIRFDARCYHTRTVHKTRTVSDSKGKSRLQHYTTTQDVVTHRATEYVSPSQTIDQSGQLKEINSNKKIIFIHFIMEYRHRDQESSSQLQRKYHNFKVKNTFDFHQAFWKSYEVLGFVQTKTFYVGQLQFNFYNWFVFFTIIGLIWPYSLWVQNKISRYDIKIKRVVKI